MTPPHPPRPFKPLPFRGGVGVGTKRQTQPHRLPERQNPRARRLGRCDRVRGRAPPAGRAPPSTRQGHDVPAPSIVDEQPPGPRLPESRMACGASNPPSTRQPQTSQPAQAEPVEAPTASTPQLQTRPKPPPPNAARSKPASKISLGADRRVLKARGAIRVANYHTVPGTPPDDWAGAAGFEAGGLRREGLRPPPGRDMMSLHPRLSMNNLQGRACQKVERPAAPAILPQPPTPNLTPRSG
jgi:hypothetical protein